MTKKMKMHPSITLDRVMDTIERRDMALDNPGFCLACGADAEGVEPDAQRVECEACGEPAVFGADEILLMMA